MATDTLGAQPLTKAKTRDRAWSKRITAWWAYLKRLYLFLLPIRFSFIALAVVGFAFLISDQGHDIIAAMTENDPSSIHLSSHPWQRFFFVPLVTFLALQIWYWSRTLLRIQFPGMPKAIEFPTVASVLPRVLGVLAYVIMLASLYRVGHKYGKGGGQPLTTLWILAGCLAGAAVLFLAFVIGRRRVLEKKRNVHVTDQVSSRQELPPSTKWVLRGSLLIASVFFLSSCFFTQQTGQFGSMGIVLLAMALWVSFGSVVVYGGTMAGVPVLTLLLILALAISPLTDNHVVPTLADNSGLVTSRPTVAAAFDRWSKRLQNDDRYRNEGAHPVFVVATEGGGIRAAYWTAAVLTALDDGIPGFRDHLFAVSGVSGGSVGAATYAALVTRQMDSPGVLPKLRPVAQQMLAYDALAPTLAAMTQQDFVQRFIPFPFLPDRGHALEGGWEQAWKQVWKQRHAEDDRFGRGFLAMLHGREDRMPSFFLNGTTVETGQRMIGSNCQITPREFSHALDVFTAAGADLRVSTTAHNSARFTYISPAGTFLRNPAGYPGSPYDCAPEDRCEHVVDGGYFDNSGAITAAEIVRVIQQQKSVPVTPYVLVIRYTPEDPPKATSERWVNEVLSPVRALLSTRGGRADLGVAQITPQTNAEVLYFNLVQHRKTIPLPLGWLLSLHTRGMIDAQVGNYAQENQASIEEIAHRILHTTVRPDEIQQKEANAPAVKEMTQKK